MTVLEQLRDADPLDRAEVARWSAVLPSLPPVPDAPRRRWLPVVVAGVAGLGSVGVAVAAGVLGGPAPDPIRAHLAEVDHGMPADLRYDPDLEHARTVAASGSAALYLADLRTGGYCVEIGSPAARPRGASCVTADRLAALPLDVLAPLPDDDGVLLVGGRANDPRITTLEVRYSDGLLAAVQFGIEGAFLLEVPEDARAAALASGLTLIGRSSSGATVTTVHVPALRDDDPLGTKHDRDVPLVLTTTSDGDDLTLVLGVQGRVNLTGVRLELRFPDGSRLVVPVAGDGTFRLTLARDRWDDFASAPGELVALRGDKALATKPVGSVAWWRAHQG